jgi:DNA ligase (NAD+)
MTCRPVSVAAVAISLCVTASLARAENAATPAPEPAIDQAAAEAWQVLNDIHGIGEDMAEDIAGFFAEQHNLEVLNDLDRQLDIQDYTGPGNGGTAAASPLAGKTIVFTGALETMGRSEAKARAEALGANVTSSVSAKTDFVVIGADAGSKAEKAVKLGVKTLTEAEFREMVGAGEESGEEDVRND